MHWFQIDCRHDKLQQLPSHREPANAPWRVLTAHQLRNMEIAVFLELDIIVPLSP